MTKKYLVACMFVSSLLLGCITESRLNGPNGPKGYALAIGLYKVDPDHYGGWDGELFGCEPDAIDMQQIAARQGLVAEKLLTRAAKRDAVLDKLGELAEKLNSGDLLVVSYSGHGGQLPDQNEDEDDGLDETWCMYDGELLDDELHGAWRKFRSGVRILVFSDSCHSGTALKMTKRDMTMKNPPQGRVWELNKKEKYFRVPLKMDRLKLISRPEMRRAITKRAHLREAIKAVPTSARKPIDRTVTTKPPPPETEAERIFVSRAMPWNISRITYLKNKTFYDSKGEAAPKEDPKKVKASVILISGCQDNQYSADIGYNGLFTWMLKEVWKDGAFTGDHHKFHEDITKSVKEMNPDQMPNFSTIEPDPEFVNQKPYTVD